MGSIEESVSALLIETGNQFNAHSSANILNFEQEHKRAPSILNENDFASAVSKDQNGLNKQDDNDDVMFMSMQDFKKKFDMMNAMK